MAQLPPHNLFFVLLGLQKEYTVQAVATASDLVNNTDRNANETDEQYIARLVSM